MTPSSPQPIIFRRSTYWPAPAAPCRGWPSLRRSLAKYQEIELLLQIGEYKSGSDAAADTAIRLVEPIRNLLQQPADQLSDYGFSVRCLTELCK